MSETMNSALKAFKRMSREEEIALHGKSINRLVVFKNKKIYTRKVKHKRWCE